MGPLRHPSPLAGLALTACFVDPGVSVTADGTGTGTTAGSPTGDVTSDPTGTATATASTDATATTTTTTSTTTGTTTTAPDPTTTTDPPVTTDSECAQQGEACTDGTCCGCLTCIGGACGPGPACGPCDTCNSDGTCTPAGDGAECIPDTDPCGDILWGEENGTCYTAAANGGTCTASGACAPGECSVRGDPYITCAECIRDGHECKPGKSRADVGLGDVCHLNEQAPGCHDMCVEEAEKSVHSKFSCSDAGLCTPGTVTGCDGYKCNAQTDACLSNCLTTLDCQAGYICQPPVCFPL
jgi:hypothetical protein